MSDLYITFGEGNIKDGWTVRAYYNPLVKCIWFGTALMALGGLVSVVLKLIESIFNLKSILFKLIPLLFLLLIIIVFSINLNSNNDSKDKLVTPLIGKKLPVNKNKTFK